MFKIPINLFDVNSWSTLSMNSNSWISQRRRIQLSISSQWICMLKLVHDGFNGFSDSNNISVYFLRSQHLAKRRECLCELVFFFVYQERKLQADLQLAHFPFICPVNNAHSWNLTICFFFALKCTEIFTRVIRFETYEMKNPAHIQRELTIFFQSMC